MAETRLGLPFEPVYNRGADEYERGERTHRFLLRRVYHGYISD
jgi:hypothetical protein